MATHKTRIKTRTWDPAKTIKDEEEAAAYLDVTLEAAFEDGYFKAVGPVIWDIVRYKGIENVAQQVGKDAKALKAALTDESSADLTLVLQVVRALAFQLHASVAEAKSDV